MNKAIAIKQIYSDIKNEEFLVVDDQGVQKIIKWELSDPQPTEEQLQTAWTAYLASNPVAPLTPVEELQKQLTDLSFELMVKGVL